MNSKIAQQLNELLRENHGIYAGNWTEKSIRQAGNSDYETLLKQKHPKTSIFGTGSSAGGGFGGRQRAQIYGHWLLPSGELTGQLHDHEGSALEVLQAVDPGYKPLADPIADLMARSGVIRVRHAPPKATVVDMSHPPTALQLQQLSRMANDVEDKAGNFMWSALNGADTDTLGSGMSYDELRRFRWPVPPKDEEEI